MLPLLSVWGISRLAGTHLVGPTSKRVAGYVYIKLNYTQRTIASNGFVPYRLSALQRYDDFMYRASNQRVI